MKASERLIEQVKDILTDASRYGKRGKYTLKDINVEQETAEVTNGHEKNWPAWGTPIIVLFGGLLLAAILTIYVVRIILAKNNANEDRFRVKLGFCMM